jgi:hypothetical protein
LNIGNRALKNKGEELFIVSQLQNNSMERYESS